MEKNKLKLKTSMKYEEKYLQNTYLRKNILFDLYSN